jgi:hypothetical protein
MLRGDCRSSAVFSTFPGTIAPMIQELAARAEQRNPGLMQEIVDWR